MWRDNWHVVDQVCFCYLWLLYRHKQKCAIFQGHRLERDVETGGLQTRHYRKAKENERAGSSANRSSENVSQSNYNITPTTSEIVTPSTPGGTWFMSFNQLCHKKPLFLSRNDYIEHSLFSTLSNCFVVHKIKYLNKREIY